MSTTQGVIEMARSAISQNLRRQVAIEAARLMMEQGIADYLLAKRKAALRLGLKDHAALPANHEIELALIENRRLFLGPESRRTLRELRSKALRCMQLLKPFRPRLVGAMVSGAITSTSAVELHLYTDSVETVAMHLMDERIDYDLVERRVRYATDNSRLTPVYCFDFDEVDIEGYVFALDGERQPPLSPIDGKAMVRVNEQGVRDLINTEQSASVVDQFFA